MTIGKSAWCRICGYLLIPPHHWGSRRSQYHSCSTPHAVPGAGSCPPISFLRAGSACCDSVSLKPEEKEGGGAEPERGRGEVTAADRKWHFRVLQGGPTPSCLLWWYFGVQWYKLVLSAMKLAFQDVLFQLCSSCSDFGSPCSILLFLCQGSC